MENNIKIKRVVTVKLVGPPAMVSVPGTPTIKHIGPISVSVVVIEKDKIEDFKKILVDHGLVVEIFHQDPDECQKETIFDKLSKLEFEECIECQFLGSDCKCLLEDKDRENEYLRRCK